MVIVGKEKIVGVFDCGVNCYVNVKYFLLM